MFTVYNGPVDYRGSSDSRVCNLIVKLYSETDPSGWMKKIWS
jgi:hypothetical protein